MNRFLSIFFTIVFCFVNVLLFAQEENTKNDPTGWKKADKLYQQKGYMASANKYQMKQSAKDMSPEVMIRVANSYRLNGDAELAEYWYAQCINSSTDVEDKLHYAEVLQSTGKCEDAIRWFKDYQEETNSEREFITDCNELSKFKKHQNVDIENLKALNTKYLDYSAIMHDGGVLFTSTRGVQKIRKVTDNWTKSNFSDVFFAKMNNEGNYETVSPIAGAVNKKYHDGVTTISKSGTLMFFSRNNSKRKKGEVNLKIYSSVFVGGSWDDATELEINGDDFTTCHPSLSKDGKWLYFASDRPGGFGGMDIYVCENKNGKWKNLQNLGPTVNSSGNDLFPFINGDGVLFYSSNGHKGKGGLDVFYAEKSSMFDEGTWDTRKNLGEPFNTKKDDFGFYANEGMTKGFLTSNRFGGKGGDDIYSWQSSDNSPLDLTETKTSFVMVIDAETNSPIKNALVVIENTDGSGLESDGKTGDNGLFEATIVDGKTYKVAVGKDGYIVSEKEVTARQMMKGISFIFNLEKAKCVELFGTVVNEKYNKAVPNTTITLVNKCTGEKTVVTSQKDGSFDFCLENGCDFDIVANKESFIETETMVSTVETTVGNMKEIKIEMLPISKLTKSDPVVKEESTAEVKKHFLGDEKATFKVGQVLTLKNIYYDFNKSNIRADAQVELDYIVTMMNEFSNMEITLTSHTDSRGKVKYNKKLSEKRAISARQYIISKGISPNRIIATGYGESALKNECKDGVNCPDGKHQINRRTEILINKMD